MRNTDIKTTVTDYLFDCIRKSSGVNFRDKLPKAEYLMVVKRVQEAAENAITALKTDYTYDINLPYLAMIDGQPFSFSFEMKRSELEHITRG